MAKKRVWRRAKFRSSNDVLTWRRRREAQALSEVSQRGELYPPFVFCPICEVPCKPVQDHDHTNGQLRSYICGKCNTGLGMFKDDPDIIRKAADYLIYWKSKKLYE